MNYLETFQAPIVAGRAFSEADLAPGRHVAIVDRTFVRRVFNGQDGSRPSRARGRQRGQAGRSVDRDRRRRCRISPTTPTRRPATRCCIVRRRRKRWRRSTSRSTRSGNPSALMSRVQHRRRRSRSDAAARPSRDDGRTWRGRSDRARFLRAAAGRRQRRRADPGDGRASTR